MYHLHAKTLQKSRHKSNRENNFEKHKLKNPKKFRNFQIINLKSESVLKVETYLVMNL